jgi:hypothetical protein
MNYPIIFFLELFLLFLLSQSLTRLLSSFIYRTTKSKRVTILFMAFLFFPGTVIHELSHYLAAKLFFVRTHGIELFPKLEGDTLTLGSVSITKTDFFRRLIIGMAPFFIGTTILLCVLFYAVQNHLLTTPLFIFFIGYLVFEVGNTMFSSKKDMEGAIELLIALTIITIALYFVGIKLPMLNPESFFNTPLIKEIFQKGSLFLLAPLGIDLGVVIILKVMRN